MDMSSIGKNIRRYRTEQNIMQETLAEKTGLSSNYIGMLERGEKIPSLSTLIKLANALRVTSDMLLCDLITESYSVKNSLVIDKLNILPKSEQDRIYAVIDTLIEFADK